MPAASCSVTDKEDGTRTFAATLSAVAGPNAAFGIGSQEATCTYTDAGGLLAAKSVTYNIVDTKAPVVTVPGGIVKEATGPDGTNVVYGGVSAVDVVYGSTPVTCSPAPDSMFALGSTAVTCIANDPSGNTGSASFQVVVQDTIAPVIICGAADGLWHGNDFEITCTASDRGSGLLKSTDLAFTLRTDIPAGMETVNAATNSYDVFDAAGNKTTAGPILGNKIDKKAPTGGCATPDNAWHNENVSLACTAIDGGSGLANAGDAAFVLSTNVDSGFETDSALTDSRVIADAVGNTVTAGPIGGNKIDRKAPTGGCTMPDNVWHNDNVSLACAATDGGSGLASAGDAAFVLLTNVQNGFETDNAQTDSCVIADAVGNEVTAGPIGGNKIDRKAPTILIASPAAANYVMNARVEAGYSCAEAGSGLAACSGPVAVGGAVDTASVGAKTFRVIASDAVGNTAEQSVNYSVLYASTGVCLDSNGHAILEPINLNGSSVFKQGSTVPAKFRVGDAPGTSIGTPGLVSSLSVVSVAAPSAVINEATLSNTPDTAFRWDPAAQQWIFNISTKTLKASTTYQCTINLNDGSKIPFAFTLK